jgi:DNA-binding response OmpR family regulator
MYNHSRNNPVPTILVVDDDQAMRRLVKLNLADLYDVVDTGEPETALALALERKPDVILLDLRMPRYSGFELCQTFSSFSSTQLIPIVVVSGEAGAQTKQFCRQLGAAAYFEKPVDFDALRMRLQNFLEARRRERRSEVRVQLQVALRLSGTDVASEPFQCFTTAVNVGRSSFFCGCSAALAIGADLDVYLVSSEEHFVGKAKTIRSEWNETPFPRYGFRLPVKTGGWVLE